jgi:SAM-dependent methyltransferase
MRDSWDDADTAAAYAEFNQQHSMYRDTSRDLVALAAPDEADTVLDLCCGTGETSRQMLARLGPDGRVVGVDASAAMLAHAASAVTDPRVRWVRARAERYEATTAEVHAWPSVPVFTERVFPDLAYPVRKSLLLDRAYQKLDPAAIDHADWVAFVAVAAGAGT